MCWHIYEVRKCANNKQCMHSCRLHFYICYICITDLMFSSGFQISLIRPPNTYDVCSRTFVDYLNSREHFVNLWMRAPCGEHWMHIHYRNTAQHRIDFHRSYFIPLRNVPDYWQLANEIGMCACVRVIVNCLLITIFSLKWISFPSTQWFAPSESGLWIEQNM